MIAYLPARPLRFSPTLPLLLLMVALSGLVGWLSHLGAHEAIYRLKVEQKVRLKRTIHLW